MTSSIFAAGKFPGLDIEEAAKARLSRIGVIDVGSNSVRMVVFDGMARSPAYFFNEKLLCGLGAGLSETGRLNPEGWTKALAAMHRFTALAARMELSGLIAVATAAVRDAKDGPDFCDAVERETGLPIHVASGDEEARLAANGVMLGWPKAKGLVSDMGGSSMELAAIDEGEILNCGTTPLGPLKLNDIPEMDKRQKFIRKKIKALYSEFDGKVGRLFLVGGSWRAIARMDMVRTGYPLSVLHGYSPPIEQLQETLDWLPDQDVKEMSNNSGTSVARLSLVPTVAPVLSELIRQTNPERVVVSAYGLREGLLYRQMPGTMRAMDPLIEVSRHMEQSQARMPGFGDTLYEWIKPLFPDADECFLRLVRAGCLIHDVNWRGHPDFRAELCFASVTRANISGINHSERVFLGLSLLKRYKAKAPEGVVEAYEKLLQGDQLAKSDILGRAMRLGAMLSGSAIGVLENTELKLTKDQLILTLRDNARECFGNSVERRLHSLAQCLNVTGKIVLDE